MSIFSGKCDLFDHIMTEKHRTKEGSDKKEDLDKARVLYSDELECFNIFKEKTGGVLYQHQEIIVTEENQNLVATKCKEFEIISHTNTVEDKRLKTGKKEIITYTYKYYNKEYTSLKELNKHSVFITIEIPFNTLLDIIPYYPYIITTCSYSQEKEIIVISNENYVLHERSRFYQGGYNSTYWIEYNQRLQSHYIEVCQHYFLYDIINRTKVIPITNIETYNNTYYKVSVDTEIDYMHPIEYVWNDNKSYSHWTSPKMLNKNTILLYKDDVELYLKEDIKKNFVKLKYVENCNFSLHLN